MLLLNFYCADDFEESTLSKTNAGIFMYLSLTVMIIILITTLKLAAIKKKASPGIFI